MATIWVSSPWVSSTEKKGRGDEKNGVKVGVFIMRRSLFVRGGILKKERGVQCSNDVASKHLSIFGYVGFVEWLGPILASETIRWVFSVNKRLRFVPRIFSLPLEVLFLSLGVPLVVLGFSSLIRQTLYTIVWQWVPIKYSREVIQTQKNFSRHMEARGTTCKSSVTLKCPNHYKGILQHETLIDIDDDDKGDSVYAMTTAIDNIQYIETTNEWSQRWDKLAEAMFIEWQLEEDTLVKCLMELVSTDGWKSDNACNGFEWSDEAKCIITEKEVFDNWAMGRFAETFADVRSNEPVGYKGFDMPDGNDKFLSMTITEWPARAFVNDTFVRQEFLRLLCEMLDLSSLDRALCQSQLMSRTDMWDSIEMTEEERKKFCRVLL
ncbi:retrotransposon protein [Cucumis melo var. makuwa]|uniref:Retrotransposon protein n=2 Tax=Cucumis melo TaxID=3656 RepID=A0A5A7T2E4_CUCMM|nr:retrotransposon protein [Cucumis melo var. makuwa]TYK13943.1 retrotransposon protein [Cucumis melo var. makuwa]